MAISYKDAGVDIDAGDAFVERIKPLAKATVRPGVLGGLGGFGGLFSLKEAGNYTDPVLVSGTDGVGTKLKLAFATGIHDTVGIDLVAMCVNDILTTGAEPLFFLDYFATGALDPAAGEAVVRGIAEGCTQAGCALLGGETAELPGFYADGEYDLAGFAVGVVERDAIINGSTIAAGDAVIGVASSGVHSNGLSLARRVLPWETDDEVARTLLTPTRIYAAAVRALRATTEVRGLVHVTGGGLPGNLPRILPDGLGIDLDGGSWAIPDIFTRIAETGPVEPDEMRRTFNMGLGLCAIVPAAQADGALSALADAGETAWRVGAVVDAHEGVQVRP
ncbi:MAG: phosphoribosylformylglycinamidine cyclo-ligase [Planctomycetota bacterium]|jgi:phosphoribosylformylglycinamidine cyclo-ligase